MRKYFLQDKKKLTLWGCSQVVRFVLCSLFLLLGSFVERKFVLFYIISFCFFSIYLWFCYAVSQTHSHSPQHTGTDIRLWLCAVLWFVYQVFTYPVLTPNVLQSAVHQSPRKIGRLSIDIELKLWNKKKFSLIFMEYSEYVEAYCKYTFILIHASLLVHQL